MAYLLNDIFPDRSLVRYNSIIVLIPAAAVSVLIIAVIKL